MANIVEVVSDAESRQNQLAVDATINPGALMAVSSSAPLVSWKRTTVFANYVLAKLDDNTDGAFSLPATGVLAAEWGQIGYSFAFGRISTPQPPGIGVFGGGASATVRTIEQSNARYRLNVYLSVQNLTNRANYQGYSGALTSPFFARPTNVSPMRKVDVGTSLNF